MNRRSQINLVLLLIALLLGLAIWRLQPEPLPELTDLQPSQVSRILIRDQSGREVDLQRTPSGWQLESAAANVQRIEQLLGICTTPSLQRFPVPKGDLRGFGLSPPAILLRLDDLELAFGSTDPLHDWRYVRIANQIHLIGDGFQHHLTAPTSEFLAQP